MLTRAKIYASIYHTYPLDWTHNAFVKKVCNLVKATTTKLNMRNCYLKRKKERDL